MTVIHDVDSISRHIAAYKKEGKKIAFVPTMGALHQGHLSLIDIAAGQADITIASIFINPTQFNDPKDFEQYPVSVEKDVELLEAHGCSLVFVPTVGGIYPNGIETSGHYELGNLEHLLEGKYRPGHFQGVAQVVHRLLQIVTPDALILGSKDYQQCMVIKKLVKILDLDVEVITAPTLREASGLAMSSRNLRLSSAEKEQSAAIYHTLLYIKEMYKQIPLRQLEEEATGMLLKAGFVKVDYVSIADAHTLHPAKEGQTRNLVALVAAFIGQVRLIDNMTLAN